MFRRRSRTPQGVILQDQANLEEGVTGKNLGPHLISPNQLDIMALLTIQSQNLRTIVLIVVVSMKQIGSLLL